MSLRLYLSYTAAVVLSLSAYLQQNYALAFVSILAWAGAAMLQYIEEED